MPVTLTILPIEQTYTLLQNYLTDRNHKFSFPSINQKTEFDRIGEYIDKVNEILKDNPQTLPSDISRLDIGRLDTQIENIVYLSTLAYFYIENSGSLYHKLASNPSDSIERLKKLRNLSETKHIAFIKALTLFIETTAIENKPLEVITENYITYLSAVKDARISNLAKHAGKLVEKIDFKKIKRGATENITVFTDLLKEYRVLIQVETQTDDNNSIYHSCEENKDEFFDAEESNITEKNLSDASPKDFPRNLNLEIPGFISPNQKNKLYRFWDWIKKTWAKIKGILNKSKSSESEISSYSTNLNIQSAYDPNSNEISILSNINKITPHDWEQDRRSEIETLPNTSQNQHALFANEATQNTQVNSIPFFKGSSINHI